MPKRRATGSSRVTSSPSTITRPWSGASNPASRRRVVVLPLPLGPSSASISPRSMESDRPSTATVESKRLVRESSWRKVMKPSLPSRPAHVLIPVTHPLRSPGGEEAPVHLTHDHLALDFAHPIGNRVGRQVVTGRQSKDFTGGEQLRLLLPDEVDEGARGLRM